MADAARSRAGLPITPWPVRYAVESSNANDTISELITAIRRRWDEIPHRRQAVHIVQQTRATNARVTSLATTISGDQTPRA